MLLGLGYFVLMLLPVLGFVNIYFMRYLAGGRPLAVFCHHRPHRAGRRRDHPGLRGLRPTTVWLGRAVGGVLVLALGLLTWQEARTYTDLKTLWLTTIARNPAVGFVYNDLGNLLVGQGRAEEAIPYLRQAVALQPKAADARFNLGSALLRAGHEDEALSFLAARA